jgi:hypothetical protein
MPARQTILKSDAHLHLIRTVVWLHIDRAPAA